MAGTADNNSFDVANQQVATIYAQAFLGAADSSGKAEALVAELSSLVTDVLDKQPQFAELLSSSFIKHEDKIGILDRTLAKSVSTRMLEFLKVVSAHNRLDILSSIAKQVVTLHNKRLGRIDVTLTTSAPIDDKLRTQIVDKLRKTLGGEPLLTVVTDPTVLGGAIFRVGDKVYDGSVATQLKKLGDRMVDKTVQAIETNRARFVTEGTTKA